ncbi:hypothetical protein E4U46_000127 [Claviceps purpurea]|nr:hypothetical protein E4U50_004349 [Claviceps purpurea]KAG6292535.1 hypothetical protein E4U46_000127 [Claviceps purpurea]
MPIPEPAERSAPSSQLRNIDDNKRSDAASSNFRGTSYHVVKNVLVYPQLSHLTSDLASNLCFSPSDLAGLAATSWPPEKTGRMVSPAGNLALLILGIIALCVIIAWILKLQLYDYIRALYSYRRRQARARDAETTEDT